MATKIRRYDPALKTRLRKSPFRFTLLQAVRIAEADKPVSCPVGEGIDPAKEALHFRGSLSQSFPAGDIENWQEGGADQPSVLTTSFLSLGGAFGPLPAPYSEQARDRTQRGDTGIRDFLDIFCHRLLSVFVRIKRAHRPALQSGKPEDTQYSNYLWSFLGLLTPGLRTELKTGHPRMGGVTSSLLACAGLLNQRPVSSHMLEQVLSCTFAFPVRTRSFVGRWLPLGTDQTTRLGRNGQNCELGKTAMLGQKVWDQSAAICVELYPPTLAQLRQALPGARTYNQLKQLTDYLLGDFISVDAEIYLPAKEVPATRLSTQPEDASQLGWTSWLGSAQRTTPGKIQLRLS